MRIAVLVLLVTTTAHAEGRFAFLGGGGLEGGTITRAARPDGVAEIGFQLDWMLPGRNWGFGLGDRLVTRLTDYGPYDFDWVLNGTLRFERPDRKFRFGVGGGIRFLIDEDKDEDIAGYDFIHLDGALQIAASGPISVDFYFAWTFGCYSDSIAMPAVGDMRPATKQLHCSDMMTTTYTAGVATAFHWN